MLAYSEFINYCYSILPLASYETSDILLYLNLIVVYESLVFIGLLAHLFCSYMFFRLTTQIYCWLPSLWIWAVLLLFIYLYIFWKLVKVNMACLGTQNEPYMVCPKAWFSLVLSVIIFSSETPYKQIAIWHGISRLYALCFLQI